MIKITTNVDSVIAHLKKYRDNINPKIKIFLERLGNIGVDTATIKFNTAQYDGDKQVDVSPIEWVSDTSIKIRASGASVLFVEFGSGLKAVFSHPQAEEFGYGAGTWSENEALGGKGHWADPKGWYYEHGKISHGNPPARAMYDAGKAMREQIGTIAAEVFKYD